MLSAVTQTQFPAQVRELRPYALHAGGRHALWVTKRLRLARPYKVLLLAFLIFKSNLVYV